MTPNPLPPDELRKMDAWWRAANPESRSEPLSDADLGRTVRIRGEAHSVMQAVNRQLAHYAAHCGQIILLAKHFKGAEWKSLSIPKGRSSDFNKRVAAGETSQR